MAAITTTLVSFLKAGDHLILPEGGYSMWFFSNQIDHLPNF